jgi:hypothetical protein
MTPEKKDEIINKVRQLGKLKNLDTPDIICEIDEASAQVRLNEKLYVEIGINGGLNIFQTQEIKGTPYNMSIWLETPGELLNFLLCPQLSGGAKSIGYSGYYYKWVFIEDGKIELNSVGTINNVGEESKHIKLVFSPDEFEDVRLVAKHILNEIWHVYIGETLDRFLGGFFL